MITSINNKCKILWLSSKKSLNKIKQESKIEINLMYAIKLLYDPILIFSSMFCFHYGSYKNGIYTGIYKNVQNTNSLQTNIQYTLLDKLIFDLHY